MFDPEEVAQVISESDARYSATTLQLAEGLGVPDAWRQLMVMAQSDLLVLTFLCTYFMRRPSREPTYSVAAEYEWRWGYATLDGEQPIVLGLAKLIQGRMTVVIKHRKKILCEVEPLGPDRYIVLPGGDRPLEEMSRLEFVLWAADLVHFSILDADAGIDVEQVVAEHGTS